MTVAEKPKSKVSRFPMLELTQCSRATAESPLSHSHSYRYKSLLKKPANGLEILTWGGGSAAMAAVENGWYMKTGCCQSIVNSGSNTRIVYYIPHVGAMSIKKKIAYIKELEKIFPRKLRYLGISNGPIVKHPLGFGGGAEQRIQIGGTSEVQTQPRSFVEAKKYIMVYGKVSTTGQDRLLLLQFLRPLYQTIQVNGYLDSANRDNIGFDYYQPRLYMRLKRWFPKLTPYQLLFLSFTMHGYGINQTYFPYYNYVNGYAESFNPSGAYTSINTLVQGGYVKQNAYVSYANLAEVIKTGKLPIEDLVIKFGEVTGNRLFEKFFFHDTRESYTNLINLIGWSFKDKSLIETT